VTPGQGEPGARMVLDLLGLELRFPATALGSAGADLSRTAGGEEHPQDQNNENRRKRSKENETLSLSVDSFSQNRCHHGIATSVARKTVLYVKFKFNKSQGKNSRSEFHAPFPPQTFFAII